MTRIVPVALAVLAGMAAWLSLGVLAVADPAGQLRVGVLPPFWLLALFQVIAIGVVVLGRVQAPRLWPLTLTAFICLPWVPGRVPPAFLIWHGPLARLAWGLVVLGLAAPLLARERLWRWRGVPTRAPWIAVAVAVVALGAGCLALQQRMPAGDEPHYLVITQSLLLDGDLRIENNHARHDYLAYFAGELRPDFLRRGLDGQIYSVHAPGLPVMLAPAFAIAGYAGAVAAVIALVSFGLALVWIAAWELTGSASAAWLAWAATAFAAPGYFHWFAIYPDGVGAACTAAALAALVRLDNGPGRLSRAHLAALGAALAVLPWLHSRFAVVAGVLGAVLVLRLLPRPDRWRSITAFVAAPILSAAAWFTFFWAIWGSPSPSAPYGFSTQSSLANLRAGIPGLLFDQQFGLLPNAPIYALALPGLVAMARVRLRLAVELGLLAVLYTAAVASYPMWWGGYSAPARFLVVILPVLGLPLGILWARGGAGVRAMAPVLLTVSVAITLTEVMVDHGALLYNARDGVSLLLDWANRSVNLPLAWPSLHRTTEGEALGTAATWVLTAGALGALAVWLAARRRAPAWVVASAWLLLTVMASSSLAWTGENSTFTAATSALDLLRHWPERWSGIGWRSQPYGMVPLGDVPRQLTLASTVRGPRNPDASALLAIPLVPAGDYEVALEGAAHPSGTISVSVGRTQQVVDVIDLNGLSGGHTGLIVDLPVRVHSLTIRGDEEARRSVPRLTLRPRSVFEPGQRAEGQALRASRYGPTRIFFLDDNTFMERPGFWTRGSSTASLIVDARRPDGDGRDLPVVLVVRAGALATTAEFSVGTWRERVELSARGEATVTLPPRGEAPNWQLTIRSGPGLRPIEHDPGNRDVRNLGVWVEIR